MINEILGKIAITPKGQYVAGSYERLDLVTDNGSSYLSLKDNNVSALDTADWMVVAEKGKAFEFSDFTPEQIAELQKPASDIATTVSNAEGLRVTAETNRNSAEGLRLSAETTRGENEADRIEAEGLRASAETSRQTAEGLRQQAELNRQTNTATAIQNAETATTNAGNAASLANEVANNPDKVVSDYWHKWNTTTKTYENTGIKAKGDPSTTAQPIFLADKGVSHTNTAANNTALISAAITEAGLTNRPIQFPYVPDGQYIDINNEFIISKSIEIKGFGDNTRIRQLTFPKGIFIVQADNATISGFNFFGVPFDAVGMGSEHVGYCGVWVRASQVKVSNIRCDGLSTVIRVSSDINTGSYAENVTVENIYCKNVVFALLYAATNNLNFKNIVGHYKLMTGVSTPPHLVYSSEYSYNLTLRNLNTKGSDCYSQNGEYSNAYQIKETVDGYFKNLAANNSVGILNVMSCERVTFDGIISLNDAWLNRTSGSLILQGTNNDIKIKNIMLKMTNDALPLSAGVGTTNLTLNDVYIETNHTATNTQGDIFLQVANAVLSNITVVNSGSAIWLAGIHLFSGGNYKIINPTVSGNKFGIYVRSTASNVVFENVRKANVTGTVLSVSGGAAIKHQLSEYAESNRILAYDNFTIGNEYGYIDTSISSYATEGGLLLKCAFGKFHFTDNKLIPEYALSVAYIDTLTPNVEISCGVKYVSFYDKLCVRLIGKNDLIGAYIDGSTNTANIGKVIAGVLTSLGSAPFTPQVGRRYEYKIITFGNVVDFYIDGVKYVSVVLDAGLMTTFGSLTKHGIQASGITGVYDNLKICKVE